MDELQRRFERAAEGILENERLTTGLDDEAAGVLIDWGLSWASAIVAATDGVPDIEAKDLIQPRLKANRRLMRYVNNWISENAEILEVRPGFVLPILTPYSVRKSRQPAGSERLEKIYKQARIALGSAARPGETTGEAVFLWEAFLTEATSLNGQPAEMIAQLQALLEQYLSD